MNLHVGMYNTQQPQIKVIPQINMLVVEVVMNHVAAREDDHVDYLFFGSSTSSEQFHIIFIECEFHLLPQRLF